MSMTIPLVHQTLRRRSLHDELIEQIRQLIIEGTLEAGKKVPEKELCESYGVSRTPLREALKVLATDGLLTLETNRGAWVRQITEKDLDEVFPVMGALEALAGELACRHVTAKEISHIRGLHEQMLLEYEQRNLDQYFALNQQIHEAILKAARNETLGTQYRSLATRVRRARYVANLTEERWAQAIDEHEAMIHALEKRDGMELAKILKNHLGNKLETVRAWLRANESAKD